MNSTLICPRTRRNAPARPKTAVFQSGAYATRFRGHATPLSACFSQTTTPRKPNSTRPMKKTTIRPSVQSPKSKAQSWRALTLAAALLTIHFSPLTIHPASAATTRTILTLTVTNTDGITNGATLTLNARTRTWTNNTPASTNWVFITNSIGGCASNLYQNLRTSPLTNLVQVDQTATNIIVMNGVIDAILDPALSGGWASITAKTNYLQVAGPIVMPIPTNYLAETKTNLMTLLASNLAKYSAFAFSNDATILANVRTAGVFINPVFTNGGNYGASFSSPGAGYLSQQFGGSYATGPYTIALGLNALAEGDHDIAIGTGSEASWGYCLVVGNQSIPAYTNSIIIGNSSIGAHPDVMLLGNGLTSTASNQVMVGNAANRVTIPGFVESPKAYLTNLVVPGATRSALTNIDATANSATVTNLVVPGTARSALTNIDATANSATVTNLVVPGTARSALTNVDVRANYVAATNLSALSGSLSNVVVRDSSVTNLLLNGTNQVKGALGFAAYVLTSLASGANRLIPLTNSLIEITSGPAAAFSISGIDATGAYDGQLLILVNLTGYDMTMLNQSGLDPVPGNRILTMTGADVSTTANGIAWLYYSASQSRWVLLLVTA